MVLKHRRWRVTLPWRLTTAWSSPAAPCPSHPPPTPGSLTAQRLVWRRRSTSLRRPLTKTLERTHARRRTPSPPRPPRAPTPWVSEVSVSAALQCQRVLYASVCLRLLKWPESDTSADRWQKYPSVLCHLIGSKWLNRFVTQLQYPVLVTICFSLDGSLCAMVAKYQVPKNKQQCSSGSY